MSADTPLTDDYVADLLKADAKKDGLRFSALGLHDLLPTRPRHNAPKPNTRFLKNIIRETDQHNASLRVREAEQTKSRLQALKHSSRDGRRREDERPSKRKRVDDEGRTRHRSHRHDHDEDRRSRRHHRDEHDEQDVTSKQRSRRNHAEEPSSDNDDSGQGRGSRRQRRRSRSREDTGASEKKSHRQRRQRRRSRSQSPYSEKEDEEERRRASGHRKSHRPRRSTSPSPGRKHRGHRRTSSRFRDCSSSGRRSSPDADSDPLEAIVGPLPPPVTTSKLRSRGRTTLNSSTIDMHFSSTYDPRTDVQPNPESEDDWDQALEALRDRQRWKQQGADRLRAAGFTQDEVEKWARNGERREQDIKWAKRGEGREWDRGKIVGEDGDTDIKPEWGRLKGT